MRLLRTICICAAITVAGILGALIAPGPAQAQTKGGGTPTTPTGHNDDTTVAPPAVVRRRQTPPPSHAAADLFFRQGWSPRTARPYLGQVVIERVCSGGPRPEAYTDSKGHFQFQLGQNNYQFADASYGRASNSMESGGIAGASSVGSISSASSNIGQLSNNPETMMSSFALNGCDLRASASGYRSDTCRSRTGATWTILMSA
jgi:hypothetical protein